jgi:hypothetical protein
MGSLRHDSSEGTDQENYLGNENPNWPEVINNNIT